jgi:hypothetical protein
MPGRILLRTTPDGSQAPVDAVKIDSAQNVTVSAGNLVIGTSGKGIDFSATPGTGTSELLADYEEGTWTPNQGAGLTVIGAFSSAGVYTKVGRVVNVNFYVSGATSVAAAAGNFLTTNLPFTISGAGGVGIATNASPNATVAMLMQASTTSVISAGAIAATATIYVSATYSV